VAIVFLYRHSLYTFFMQSIFSRFKTLFIVLIIVIIVGGWMMGSYNSFVRINEGVDAQWAQVESQYQRRFDLIPNLVASVQGAMKQETAIFTAIAQARQGYAGARTTDEKVAATGALDSALSRLLVITENYPVLKSNETVQSLMAQLEGTENRISVERMRYNDLVKDYNVRVKSFPGNIFAKMFGFSERTMFKSETGAEKAPKVNI
jgi:LemA protein